MDIVIRVLLGFVVFAFVGWVTYFLFGVLEFIFNGTAYALGRGLRRVFRLTGTNAGLSAFALGLVGVTKTIYGFAIFLAIFLYSFFYPNFQAGSNLAMAVALGCLVLLWAPSVLLLGVLGLGSGDNPETASIAIYREELRRMGIVGADAHALVQHFQSSGDQYYATEAELADFEESARSAGLQPVDYAPLLVEYAETGERPSIPQPGGS